MTTLSSKRRKLHHGGPVHGSTSDVDLESGISDNDLSSDTSDEVPIKPKQAQARQKQTPAIDDVALYAGGSYKSTLFKLQIDELLAEVRPNYEKRLEGVDDALRRLKSLIESIEERDGLSVLDATKTLHKSHKISVPFPDPKPDKNAAYKLAYAKPTNINVVGSYVLKTMAKSDSHLSVDMVMVMPDSIFQEKDYLNYRYYYKRAYYLACVAAGLQDSVKDDFLLSFEYLNENELHPILSVKPKPSEKSKGTSNYEIRIIPAAPQNLFANSKLLPSKNSVRPKGTIQNDSTTPTPTPFYNASLRSDCNLESYLKFLNTASRQSTGFRDACILGGIWLRQRGFGSGISRGGFGNFEWSALIALLFKAGGPKATGVLSPGYSSYQMFKAVIQYISANDLTTKPLVYDAAGLVLQKSGLPTIYDGPRGQNILYKMTPWSYSLLREEAQASLKMLNDDTFDQFESTFIVRESQSLLRYDCLVQVPIPTEPLNTRSCDHTTQATIFSNRVHEVLREGLMDRVKTLQILMPKSTSWSVKTAGPLPSSQNVLISAVFDSANVDRLVDHGPAAEEKKKAAKFQKFWGEKAELRRFKDGSILESLVWSPGSAYSIYQEIVVYLIKRHFSSDVSGSLRFVGDGFEKLLYGFGTNTKQFEALRQAFSGFEQQIRNFESLPLQLRQFSAVSPQLRYAQIESPSFGPRRPLMSPADVLIQFEGSGRWPDDVVAIQRTKIAFLLKIGSLLQSDRSTTTRVGLEYEDQPLTNSAFLDVIYESGAAFRLRIHNEREQTLLERLIKDKSIDHRAREDAVSAMSAYKRSYIQVPYLTQQIATHCTRFPLLSSTIRLTKLWFDRHMLLGHISEEVVELMVARTFLQPYPWQAPSSAMTGFLRTLLFISRWDWRLVPLIVDFTGELTSKYIDSINTRLEAWRKIDPGMNRTVLIAASNFDDTGTAFTDTGPSKLVASRMTALARSACKLVKDQGFELDPRSLFVSSTTEFDFVIHLSSQFTKVQQGKETTQPKFKNLEVQAKVGLELVGYQPVQAYLSELEKLYTNSIVFFHGMANSSVIAGLWNPQVVAPRPFKVNLTYATKVVSSKNEGEAEVEINKAAILAEIARLGGDMVSRIEFHR